MSDLNLKTYSFLSVQAALSGPGGIINLAQGAAAAEEGIDIERSEDVNTMTVGADGNGMHSLSANQSGRVIVRFLKDSPTNSLMSALYAVQTASPANHGQNTIVITNVDTGDVHTCQQCAIKRFASVKYGKNADMIAWEFDSIRITSALGS